jgi:hypothetical protein
MPTDPLYTDADVALVSQALLAAPGNDHDQSWSWVARVVLDALTAPGSPLVARIRAQAGEGAARAIEVQAESYPEGSHLSIAAHHAARIARQTTSTEEAS